MNQSENSRLFFVLIIILTIRYNQMLFVHVITRALSVISNHSYLISSNLQNLISSM